MSTTDDYQVPVRDGRSSHPQHTAPEEMYWLSHLDQSELTEKYVSLRDNFYTLKKYSTKQEDKIKKMQTKLRKITSDRKKDGVGLGVRSVKEVEYEETVEVQRHALRELRSRNQHLEKKLKLANVQLSTARKNKPLMFRHVGPRVDSGLKPCRSLTKPTTQSNPSPHMMFSSPSEESSPLNSATSPQHRPEEVLPGRVREILEEARERIFALEAERDDLQEQLNEKQQSVEAAEYELQQRAGELEEEVAALRGELRAHSQREEREAVAAVRAGRETRALTARCTALTEQLAATEEKVAVERTTRADLNADLEKTTSRLLSTETKLRESQEELQKVSSKLQQITEKKNVIESENVQLQRENERLTSLTLSSEPRELSSENEALKAQVAHLEAALQLTGHQCCPTTVYSAQYERI
ncbi:hypothetical protein Pmani_026022 [Petrolisthes manimaculis]|uniref:Uncharacterized protein n=1 Tax=Petrolisthes manimaculis TaxID=1843537 RepID=A0AAE1P6V0_9EUCA|nr:hypothetical protein Pmani_026022 [Petrolisthes manimaculis]